MTAPIRGTPSLSAIPASQNSAPVAEYRCLFTHDLRRKQKRWQDGYLKFHTFNSRIMVYDASRNYIGDTYWKDSHAVQEGDELTLDKGIMVEIAEAMGITQTDLTPLLKKSRESPRAKLTGPPVRPFSKPSMPSMPASRAPRGTPQLRHKSLNALLGTPRGPVGKSVAMQSPFEARKDKENHGVEVRAAKRQKTANDSATPALSSPIRDKTPVTKGPLPLSARTSDSRNARAPAGPLPRQTTVISISSEPDISSKVTLPSTPPGMQKQASRPSTTSAPISDHEQPSVPVRTPKLPRGKLPFPQLKVLETPRPRPAPSSPPVSLSNRLSNVDILAQPVQEPAQESSPPPPPPPRNAKAKSLRLSTGVKRGMLLCQAPPQQASRTMTEPPRAPLVQTKQRQKPLSPEPEPITVLSDDDEPLSRSKPAQLNKASNTRAKKRKEQVLDEETATSKRPKTRLSSPQLSLEDDDLEIMQGIMDEQLVVSPLPLPKAIKPPKLKSPAEPAATKSKNPAGTKTSVQKRKAARDTTPSDAEAPPVSKPKPAPQRKPAAKPRAKRKPSPHPVPSPLQQSPTRSPPPAKPPPAEPTRTTSAPPKKIPLSTGGFRKKPKRTEAPHKLPPGQITILSDAPGAVPITVTLPPRPPRSANLEDDPIEDGSQSARVPRNASTFRRVRSENDAPIPSASEDWETRNRRGDDSVAIAAGGKQIQQPPLPLPPPKLLPKAKAKAGGLAALIHRTDPRKKFLRTQSLNVDTSVANVGVRDAAGSGSLTPELVSPPVDHDVGPWSTEAFDLFDWRPPGKEGEGDEEEGAGLLVDG